MSTFHKINRPRTLVDEVTGKLKAAIISGHLREGQPLPSETDLSSQLGVSRPVIREAVKSLQSRGLLEVRRGTKGGAYVQDLNKLTFSETLFDLLIFRKITVDHLAQVRLFLEPEIIRLVAENATDEDLAKIKNLLVEYDSIEDIDRRVTMNADFHRLLCRACANPIYSMLMESIMDFTQAFVETIKPVNQMIHNDSDHKEIFEAIEARNTEKAVKISVHHATFILDKMRKLEKTYLGMLFSESAKVATGRKTQHERSP
jgi:DNA-binding FadR family transcriptional regulator